MDHLMEAIIPSVKCFKSQFGRSDGNREAVQLHVEQIEAFLRTPAKKKREFKQTRSTVLKTPLPSRHLSTLCIVCDSCSGQQTESVRIKLKNQKQATLICYVYFIMAVNTALGRNFTNPFKTYHMHMNFGQDPRDQTQLNTPITIVQSSPLHPLKPSPQSFFSLS